MKNLLKIVLLICLTITIVGCPSDDASNITPARDRQEVYDEDKLEIEDYLKSNYLVIDANGDATALEIPEGGTQTSIWDEYKLPTTGEPPFLEVKNDARTTFLTDGRINDDVDYKLYYIKLNEGGGQTPTSVDSTFVSYKGWNLENVVFDQNNSGIWFSFPAPNASISGFRQVLSTIKTASSVTENPNGSVNYNDAGNVLVFIPSGLAYFNSGRANINAYSPIVFQIKLFNIKERDHDSDEVPSKYEDLNNDNDYFNDDTDGDKIPDFIDNEDDGDGFLTKFEVKKPTPFLGTSLYYPYNPNASEPKGIPDASGNGTNTTRLRRHLDRNTKPPYTVY